MQYFPHVRDIYTQPLSRGLTCCLSVGSLLMADTFGAGARSQVHPSSR